MDLIPSQDLTWREQRSFPRAKWEGVNAAEDGCDPHPLPCFFLKKSGEKFRKARGEVWGMRRRRRRDKRGDPVMSSVEFPTG